MLLNRIVDLSNITCWLLMVAIWLVCISCELILVRKLNAYLMNLYGCYMMNIVYSSACNECMLTKSFLCHLVDLLLVLLSLTKLP